MLRREQNMKATIVAVLTSLFMAAGIAAGIACGSAMASHEPESTGSLVGFLLDKQEINIERLRNQEVLDNMIVSRVIPVAIDGDGALTVTRNGYAYEKAGMRYLYVDDLRSQVRFDLEYTGADVLDAIEIGDIPDSIRNGDTVALNRPSKATFISVRFAAHEEVVEPEPAKPGDTAATPAYTPAYTPVYTPATTTTVVEPIPEVQATPEPAPAPVAVSGYPWALESDYQTYYGRPLPALDKSLDSVSEYIYTGLINGYMEYDVVIDQRTSFQNVMKRIGELHSGPGGKGSDIWNYVTVNSSMSSFYPDGSSHMVVKFAYKDGVSPVSFDNDLYNTVKSLNLGGLSDYDKTIGIYNWMANRLSYAYSAQGGAVTAKDAYYSGVANCMGYSTLFKAMCEKVGIEVETVSGNHFAGAVGHMWTIALIDGSWRGYDTCWADAVGGTNYLCVGYGAAMDGEHIPD